MRARSANAVGRVGWVAAAIVLIWAGPAPAAPLAETTGKGAEAVARAFFEALASGDAGRFEAMARERYAPAQLARRSAEERKAFVERLRGDFGPLTLDGVRNLDDSRLTLAVSGATGLRGTIELELEPAPASRIVSVKVEVGDSGEEPAEPPPPVDARMSDAELARSLDAWIGARAASGAFAGVVAVARQGRPLFEKAYGIADREQGIPATARTRYNVASIGKLFTRTAIGQLLQAGRLSLADTVGRWRPDYPEPKVRAATIEQLLEHRGGIADFFGPEFERRAKTDFLSNADYDRFVSSLPLLFDPGSRRQYCNGCYVVLGEVVARVAGQRYEDYVSAHVFGAAGMKAAGFLRGDRPAADVAQSYSRELPGSAGRLANAREAHGAAGSAAGGCYATAADLLAFDEALRTGRLLDAARTAWILGDVVSTAARAPGAIAIAGGAPGVNAQLESDEAWAVAVVANLDPPAASFAQAIHRRLSRP